MMIICDKKSEYSIVIPTNPAPVEETAAAELQQYLNKTYGVELPIVSESKASGKAFYIGRTDYAKAAGITGKSVENWIIKEDNGNVILTGGVKENDRGIIYAVYHFLEDIVGVRWWSNFEEYIPDVSELALEEDFCKEGTPAFYYRKILGYRQIEDFSYEARTRTNVVGDDGLPDEVYNPSVKKYGGAMPMGRPWHVHTINKYFPAAEYFEAHPDWFAWSDVEGKRIPYAHYCLSNEELVQAVTDKLLGFIEEDKKLAKEHGVEMPCFYDISFPDSMGGLCQCAECKAAMAKSGNSGYAIRFVNKIAKVVAEKHPDVKLETLAYAVYTDPPLDDTLPEPNVIIRLAQVYSDIIHDIENKGNKPYARLLKQWSEICKKSGSDFYIWEYMFHLFFDLPLPVSNRLCNTFRSFYEHGVTGVFAENEGLATDMWELQHYMMLHLCEDPYLEPEDLIDDFMPRYYGAAGCYVKAYLDELIRSATENNTLACCIIESMHHNYLDYKAVKKGMKLLNKARKAVSGNPIFTRRVDYVHTLLGCALLVKYFDLKKMAEADGETFEFDREAVRKMVINGLETFKNHPRYYTKDADPAHSQQGKSTRIDNEIKFYSSMVFSDEPDHAPMPAELSGVNPDDVYQFFYKNSMRHINDMELYGVSYVDDPDSCLGRVEKLCRADACDPLEVSALLATSRDAETAGGVQIYIQQDGEYVTGVELYKEDIVPDEYHLYKIGSVDGIRESGDTRVDIFGNNFNWLSLSGMAVTFPMDACDVYLSIKFAGEIYGGSCDAEEAVYLDRAIIVRK